MNLYALTAEYNNLLAKLQDSDDMSDDDMSALLTADGELTDKLESYANVISELEADSEKLAKEAKRLLDRRKTIDNNIERMKTAVANTLILQGLDKKKTAHWTLGFRKSSVVEVKDNDEEAFVNWCKKYSYFELYKTSYDVNKTAVRKMLEDGKEVPAYIVEKKKLQIK